MDFLEGVFSRNRRGFSAAFEGALSVFVNEGVKGVCAQEGVACDIFPALDAFKQEGVRIRFAPFIECYFPVCRDRGFSIRDDFAENRNEIALGGKLFKVLLLSIPQRSCAPAWKVW